MQVDLQFGRRLAFSSKLMNETKQLSDREVHQIPLGRRLLAELDSLGRNDRDQSSRFVEYDTRRVVGSPLATTHMEWRPRIDAAERKSVLGQPVDDDVSCSTPARIETRELVEGINADNDMLRRRSSNGMPVELCGRGIRVRNSSKRIARGFSRVLVRRTPF